MDETSDFWVHVSPVPFASDDLDTILADNQVTSFFVTGAAGRPTELPISTTGKYVRVQLSKEAPASSPAPA